MTDFHGFKGRAKRLDDIDLPKIGHRIGVGEDELHAFMDVEAAGAGFDGQGRPKMLFEPHIFYRELSHDPTLRARAVTVGLAYQKWGTKPYPKESYSRLVAAITLAGEDAALRSCSWGATQILGSNCEDAGYKTPQAMVLSFMDDEENQLNATVTLLVAMQINDDVKAHRWATVARVWNGPGYSKNHYDTKMATAFTRWQKIKDTPWTPGQPDVPAPAKPVQPVDAPAAPSTKPTGFPMPPPSSPAAGPTPKQTGIGALILAALVAVGSQFHQVWAFLWPWGLTALAIIAVAGVVWWRRTHFTKGN